MDKLLENVAHAARDKYHDPQDISDLVAAASLAKTIADANKAQVEAENHVGELRLERLKSWSSLLVPVVSLLTLVGTIVFQAFQLQQQTRAAYRQNEDAEWRDLIGPLRGSSTNYASDITVPSRLQPFLGSERYRDQARNLAVRLMGNLTNVNTFVELYNLTVKDYEDELKLDAGIARVLTAAKQSLESECLSEANDAGVGATFPFGVCTVNLPYDTQMRIVNQMKNRAAAHQKRITYVAVVGQLTFISNRIASLLPRVGSTDPVNGGRDSVKGIDLSFLTIGQQDLSHVDFSDIDLSGANLLSNKLNGAKCTPRKFDYIDIADSEWWNCDSIDQSILATAIQFRYPYWNVLGKWYPSGEVTREYYEERVKALCSSKAEICKPPLPFGEFQQTSISVSQEPAALPPK